MCWKFNNLGYKNIATLNTYAIHLGSMTFKSIPDFKIFLLSRNRIYTFWQNLSTPAFFILIPIVIVLRIVALSLLTILGKIKLNHLFSGLKGMAQALLKLKQYPKYNYSILVDLKNLFTSNRVIKEPTL
jgi:GT2 family glycosyltransferase